MIVGSIRGFFSHPDNQVWQGEIEAGLVSFENWLVPPLIGGLTLLTRLNNLWFALHAASKPLRHYSCRCSFCSTSVSWQPTSQCCRWLLTFWPPFSVCQHHFASQSSRIIFSSATSSWSSSNQPHQLDHLLISHIKLIISHINFLSAKINLITPWPFKALKLFHAAQAVFDWIQPCNLRLPVKAQVKYMASPSNIWKKTPLKQSSLNNHQWW